MKLKYLIPFLIFVALVALFAYAFRLDPREVPSPLVGKPAPAFALPRVDAPGTLAGPAGILRPALGALAVRVVHGLIPGR